MDLFLLKLLFNFNYFLVEHQPIDLTNCTAKNQKFACKDKYKCIDMRETCNGEVDCYDKSDETGACRMSSKF